MTHLAQEADLCPCRSRKPIPSLGEPIQHVRRPHAHGDPTLGPKGGSHELLDGLHVQLRGRRRLLEGRMPPGQFA